jgi:hypothetical protein
MLSKADDYSILVTIMKDSNRLILSLALVVSSQYISMKARKQLSQQVENANSHQETRMELQLRR